MAKPKTAKQKVSFSYTAPDAQTVLLAGDFTDWKRAPVALERGKDGVWEKTIPLAPGRYQYRLLVDGQWRDDPQCSTRQPNQFGGENCVCVVTEPARQPAPPPPAPAPAPAKSGANSKTRYKAGVV